MTGTFGVSPQNKKFPPFHDENGLKIYVFCTPRQDTQKVPLIYFTEP